MDNATTKVLLVEDDEDDYIITSNLFRDIQEKKFEVEWIRNYDNALEIMSKNQHDVYLVDFRLGIKNGVELLEQATADGCKAPIILLTGQGDSRSDVAAMKAGAADYLIKGQIDATGLERAISHAIERTHTLEKLRQALQENSRLASAIANITTGVVITDPKQPNNPIIFANPGFTAVTGYTQEEVLGCNCRFLQGKETDATTLQQLREAIAQACPHTCVLLNYRKDGTPFWNELSVNPVFDSQGELTYFVGLQTDVSDRKQSEAALRESEERYALAVRGANDGIWDWNLKTSEIYFSPRWKSMLGYLDEEITNQLDEWFERVHPEDLDWVKVKIAAHLDGLTPHFENEHRMLHRDGTYRWMLSRGLAVRDAKGKATRIAGSQTDITTHKQAEEQLLHDAFYDALTGLPNRALLTDRLKQVVQMAKRDSSYQFAVLFIDVDRFKVINDSLGHMLGDELLMAIAQRLCDCLRPTDTVARLGGDEFVILLEDINDVNSVTTIADRVQQELTLPFSLNGHEVFTSASIGIALSETGYELPEDLLRDADTAMYRAKAQGRARYEIFNTGMHVRALALLHLETDLRRAIAADQLTGDRQEFQLYYQPIVSLKTRCVVGFEALLRWQHPTRGFISPVEFIPIAEETGLIIPIGDWVLREACRQMQIWHAEFPMKLPLSLSVNLSSKQFTPRLIRQIERVLQDTHLDTRSLRLEITESALMENLESAADLLAQVRSLGIQLSMDDFGTGYSSLSYLHRFPIDTLKIDRSFIKKVDADGEQLAIVRTIITLAWNLGMDVVAEGVETLKQLAQLRSLKCEYGQGYLFSKPLDSQAAQRVIAAQSQLGIGIPNLGQDTSHCNL
ncbi:EAL domain-containing protein [Leptolyngbya sp. FACHB-541]|uniref:EAL domain-containing protein n=1 Tax=Leptolyngbya sp. FACHB-541 TaxID=2692810 RepID=UPI00168686F9|nr:EAL domain-containing protein [Leptolyngbya sp. FACHB-541]MBD2000050.1 EAL domain-containing protein [Leptolyngbya sp. FACHB-541]